MFKGHWLVADVDGTLLPTPSKAGGLYLSFASACARREAQRPDGARRYHSCLPALTRFIRSGGSLCVVSTAGKRLWQQVYTDLAPALFPPAPPPSASPGRLLICGFTGAALFRSLPRASLPAEWQQCHTPEGYTGPPPPSVALEEWADYRVSGQTTLSDVDERVAVEEGRAAIIRFFEHASAVSGHDIHRASAFFTRCLSAKYHCVYTDMLREMLAETGTAPSTSPTAHGEPVCFADTEPMKREYLTTHGYFLKETHDALLDSQRVPRADGTVAADAPVAQVVVMGVPMAAFPLIFQRRAPAASDGTGEAEVLRCCPKCFARSMTLTDGAATEPAGIARLEARGLAVKRQPNSVCIHKESVDKGTCVRWLVDHGAELGGCEGEGFSLHRALSFGDVPATVDRPLAEFPPMRMISVSPLPNDGCASPAALERLVEGGMLHVGGEEEGTAVFLDYLLDDCERSAQGAVSTGGTETWFTAARVASCAAKAAKAVS